MQIKLSVFFLFVFLQVSAHTTGQINLSVSNQPLDVVFQLLRKRTDYKIFAKNQDLEGTRKVTFQLTNASIEQIMQKTLEGQPLAFTIKDKSIFISRIATLSSPQLKSTDERPTPISDPIEVEVRVTNQDGDPVAGVTIQEKGGKIGGFTNSNGVCRIKTNPQSTLILTAVNITTEEVPVEGRKSLNVKVNGKTGKLDEVQVIAYGTTSKRITTGNTATVKAEDIERQPVNNPLLALQGRVPGLEVTQANGIPGGGITVRIQGRNNLSAAYTGSDPLIVIDGVPYASQTLTTYRGGSFNNPILGTSSENLGQGYGNPLSFINPADIESIDVLKDADATAIYGSRAANGALLITTKKGKSGATRINIDMQKGWGKVGNKMHLLNSEQFMEMRREAKRNDNAGVVTSDFDLRGLWDTTRYTDWQKELIGGTAGFTRITAGVTGGSANVQYLISGTYSKENSVFPGEFANTSASVHFNLSTSSTNQRFKMKFGGSYLVNSNKLPAEDFTWRALNMPPVAPRLYNENGTLNWAPDTLGNGNSSWFNPLASINNLFDNQTNNLVSNASISYQLFPFLDLKSSFGYTTTASDQFIGALDEAFKPEARPNRVREAFFTYNTTKSWIIEPQINFQQRFNFHHVEALLGASFQEQTNSGRGFSVNGQPSDQLLRQFEAGASVVGAGADIAQYRYSAVFGRLTYDWKAKYLVNLTARRDGSSRFGANNRFGNFGAVGIGWIISEEKFLKTNVSIISFAKLRGSYGTTGNDQIGNYLFMNLFGLQTYGVPYQGHASVQPSNLPNPNLEWEKNKKLQGGIDLGLWKDRLLLSINYYRNRCSNTLMNIGMPAFVGYNGFIDNIPALIENKGWEFSANAINLNSGELKWNTTLNLTIPNNKVLAFPNFENSPLRNQIVIGEPIGSNRVVPFYGIDPQNGRTLFRDHKGDPVYTHTPADATTLVNSATRWFGGIQNGFTFKGFSLDFLFQFTRRYAYHALTLAAIPGRMTANSMLSVQGNQPVEIMQRWQTPGDISIYQRFTTGFGLGNFFGDRDFKNASYVRLKNVSIAYQFPNEILQRLKIQQLRIFSNAQNLFTITAYRGLDPETLSISSLPPLRMIVVGVQAGF